MLHYPGPDGAGGAHRAQGGHVGHAAHVLPGHARHTGHVPGDRGPVSQLESHVTVVSTGHRTLVTDHCVVSAPAGNITDSLAPTQRVAHPDTAHWGAHCRCHWWRRWLVLRRLMMMMERSDSQVRRRQETGRSDDINVMRTVIHWSSGCSYQPGNIGGALVSL